jgi:hypothetical protein
LEYQTDEEYFIVYLEHKPSPAIRTYLGYLALCILDQGLFFGYMSWGENTHLKNNAIAG